MEIGDSEQPGQAMEDFSAGILKGRAAETVDSAGTARFLASTDSDYMTAQVIMIDGGMVLV
jgi:meso-butanediol dehydrogenase/(S,S)-butanediol dehydrogenase/diacetyl reductase